MEPAGRPTVRERMTTPRGITRRAVALALLVVAPLPLIAQQETPASLLTVREIDDLARPIARLPDEALEQVLRLLAERPAWAIALGRAYRQQPGDLRAAIENQRRVNVVAVPVLTPMPTPAPVVQAPPTVVAPAPVIVQQQPIIVHHPTVVVPNPIFAPRPVIVHAPPIVHVRPWGLWPWTRTIVERPIYLTTRDDRGRDREDRGRADRGGDDRGRARDERARAERPAGREIPVRTAKPRVASARP